MFQVTQTFIQHNLILWGRGVVDQAKTFGSKVKSLSTLHIACVGPLDIWWLLGHHKALAEKLLVYSEGTLSSRISPPQEVRNFFKWIVCSNGHFFLSAIFGLFFHHLPHIKGKTWEKNVFCYCFYVCWVIPPLTWRVLKISVPSAPPCGVGTGISWMPHLGVLPYT